MYLETRDIDETMRIYQSAWEKGVKTTYYLHMKPRHTAEQSTTNVNKATQIGKVGFGALKFKTAAPDVAPQPFAAPLQKTIEMDAEVKKPEPINEGLFQTAHSTPAKSEVTPVVTHEVHAEEKSTEMPKATHETKNNKPKGFVSLDKLKREVKKGNIGPSDK
jgi:hypothetical protein